MIASLPESKVVCLTQTSLVIFEQGFGCGQGVDVPCGGSTGAKLGEQSTQFWGVSLQSLDMVKIYIITTIKALAKQPLESSTLTFNTVTFEKSSNSTSIFPSGSSCVIGGAPTVV